MTYLLDTNAFSDLMRDHPRFRARLARLPPIDQVLICVIVRGEILYGISRLAAGRRQQELKTKAEHLFAGLACEPVPPAAGDHYAAIKRCRERQGLALDENDLWIAATARSLGAILISRDDDFHQIDDLQVEDWTT